MQLVHYRVGWPKLNTPVVNLLYLGSGIQFYDYIHHINFQLLKK